MTINSQIRTTGPFVGTGLTTVFPFAFKVFQASDLMVSRTDTGLTQTTLALSADYTVLLNTDQNVAPGGSVTLLAALPLNYSLTITSSIALLQPLSLPNQGGFFPRNIEDELDRLTILLQQLNFNFSQALRVPEVAGVPGLPAALARANNLLGFDSLGNPVAVAPVSGSAAALAIDLANSTLAAKGAGQVGFGYALAYVAGTVGAKLRQMVSVKDFGAVGDGVTNDTAAINIAITAASVSNVPLFFPGGTYIVTPATSQVGAATYNTALLMKSNLHCIGYDGATIKISDNYSIDASPKELAIFSTSVAVSNVSFTGLTFDLNGANNKMSPARPATYNQFNHAAIICNGPTGRADDLRIDKCVFKNTAGVCFIVSALVAAGTTPALGQRWKILNNYFLNGGSDTNDHTSVYAWAEDVLCEGNTFWEDTPPHTIGKTGGATCYEVHGSNQRFVNNYCFNYTLGAYIAPNFTTSTVNTIIQGNTFYCTDFGVLLWRGVALGYLSVDGVLIQGNTFYFDNYTYTGQSTYKSAVAYQGQIATAQGAINNVKISQNYAINTGATLLSQFVRWDTSVTASQTGSNLSVTDNQVIGFCDGIFIVTNAANGIGLVEVSRNQFIGFTPDSLANPPHGVYVLSDVAGLVKTLVIDNNQFIDERVSPQFAIGIYLSTGTITDFYLGPQVYKGITTNYTDLATVTNWKGQPRAGKATIAYSASMTPDASAAPVQVITVTNTTAFTINAPTRPTAGNAFTLQIKNSSGGVMGVITWSVVFARSAWTNPANGQNRSITFAYDGVFWVQISQTGADIPN